MALDYFTVFSSYFIKMKNRKKKKLVRRNSSKQKAQLLFSKKTSKSEAPHNSQDILYNYHESNTRFGFEKKTKCLFRKLSSYRSIYVECKHPSNQESDLYCFCISFLLSLAWFPFIGGSRNYFIERTEDSAVNNSATLKNKAF